MRLRWVPPALLLLVGCAAEEIVLATADGGVEADQVARPVCSSDRDCGADEFCDEAACGDAEGVCRQRPVLCGTEPDPVCGCDHITYYNECLRRSNGVRSSTRGQCEGDAVTLCGGSARTSCPAGSSCARLGSICSAEMPGTCWVLPIQCAADPMPSDAWTPCDDHERCVDTCSAIRSQAPHVRASECHR